MRKMVTCGTAKEPKTAPLAEGEDGGGGVRVYPPSLSNVLSGYAEFFQPQSMALMPRSASMTEGGTGSA